MINWLTLILQHYFMRTVHSGEPDFVAIFIAISRELVDLRKSVVL